MIYSLNIVIFHGYVRHVPSFSVVKWPVFSSEITLILIPCERVSYCEISLWMSAIIGNPKIGCCIQYQGNIGIILDTSWILHRIYDTLECIWVRYCRYMENKLKTPQWQFFSREIMGCRYISMLFNVHVHSRHLKLFSIARALKNRGTFLGRCFCSRWRSADSHEGVSKRATTYISSWFTQLSHDWHGVWNSYHLLSE